MNGLFYIPSYHKQTSEHHIHQLLGLRCPCYEIKVGSIKDTDRKLQVSPERVGKTSLLVRRPCLLLTTASVSSAYRRSTIKFKIDRIIVTCTHSEHIQVSCIGLNMGSFRDVCGRNNPPKSISGNGYIWDYTEHFSIRFSRLTHELINVNFRVEGIWGCLTWTTHHWICLVMAIPDTWDGAQHFPVGFIWLTHIAQFSWWIIWACLAGTSHHWKCLSMTIHDAWDYTEHFPVSSRSE